MYSQRINYVVVGAFVSAMLLAGGVSIALLSGRTGATDPYHLVLDNVADVKFGTQVRYEGFPVGQVEQITPLPDGARMRFRIDVSVRAGWRIPSDSLARIAASTFLAAKTVDISSGDSATVIPPGGRIPSAAPADIFTTMATTAAEIGELSRTSLKPLLDSVAGLAQGLGRDVPHITGELSAFMARLNLAIAPLETALDAGTIEAARRSVHNLEETSARLASISRGLEATLSTADDVVGNVDRLIADNRNQVDQSLKDVRYTLAAVAQTVDAIVHNLEGATRNMNEFTRLIRQNPGLLLNGQPREAVSPTSLGGQRAVR